MPRSQKKIAIVTDIPFWRKYAGHCSRISALVRYLKESHQISIIFGGFFDDADCLSMDPDFTDINIYCIDSDSNISKADFARLVHQVTHEFFFNVCILEYVELSYLIDLIPKRVRKILDTHDIKSQRESSIQSVFGSVASISFEAEIQEFKKFDRVVLINQVDYNLIGRLLDFERVIYAPHAVSILPNLTNKHVKHIGFVGSNYIANIDALWYFLNNVWDKLKTSGVRLLIFGNVLTGDRDLRLKVAEDLTIDNRGPYNDATSVYSHLDLAVNPVRIGAGLKIKNVEAIANGIPLVTTSHGARGLEDGIGSAFFVADEHQDFVDVMVSLMSNYELRCTTSRNAVDYASAKFSPEYCYGNLNDYITTL